MGASCNRSDLLRLGLFTLSLSHQSHTRISVLARSTGATAMLTRVFVLIAVLAWNSNAASLQSSASRQDRQDLEVITLDSKGNPAETVYYSYDQLLTLPTVTVKTERDPNTNTPATYTGIYISDLFEALDPGASFDVIGAIRLDKYRQYYDRDYVARHRPILLLKFDGKVPDDWPQTEDRNMLGPYCIVHESFSPAGAIYSFRPTLQRRRGAEPPGRCAWPSLSERPGCRPFNEPSRLPSFKRCDRTSSKHPHGDD